MTDWILHDLRFGVRQLLRSPGFALAACLTLALGVGANTIIFSIVNGILFRPLPVERPQDVVALYATDRRTGRTRSLSFPEYLDYRDRSGIFAGLVAQLGRPLELRRTGPNGDGVERDRHRELLLISRTAAGDGKDLPAGR